ncbi:MAG TPA: hypothetical protein VGL61_21155 [Kofleriaceae bacterium]
MTLDPRDLCSIARSIFARSGGGVHRYFVRLVPPAIGVPTRRELPTVRMPRID